MAAIFWVTALQLKLPAGHPMGVTAKSGAAVVEAMVVDVTAVTEAVVETAGTVAAVEVTAGMVVGVTDPFGWTNMVHQPVLISV
jgi:hypothetical protein